MSFNKPHTGTFAYQGTIPSQSMNNINDAFPSILDKTGDNSDSSPTGGISGRIDVLSSGSIKLKSGAELEAPVGSTLNIGGSVAISAGSTTYNNGSGITFNDSSYLTFNTTGLIIIGPTTSLLSAGPVSMTSGSILEMQSGSELKIDTSAALNCQSGGTINLLSGGIFNGLSGSFFNLTDTVSTFNNAIISFENGSTLATSGTSYITINSSGILQVSGGTLHVNTGTFTVESAVTSKMGEFPQFITPKTRTVCESPLDGGPGSGTWLYNANFVYSSGSAGGYWVKNLNRVHHGATLTQVTVSFAVFPHLGTRTDVPGVTPGLGISRYSPGNLTSPVYLSTTSTQYMPSPGSGSAYYASGSLQYLNYYCNQNNVIDNTAYVYVLTIIDESGANSYAGDAYGTIQMQFTSIPNLSWNI